MSDQGLKVTGSKRVALAYLAGVLFLLAGIVSLVGQGTSARPAGVAGIFSVVGMLWFAVAAKLQKDDALRRADTGSK